MLAGTVVTGVELVGTVVVGGGIVGKVVVGDDPPPLLGGVVVVGEGTVVVGVSPEFDSGGEELRSEYASLFGEPATSVTAPEVAVDVIQVATRLTERVLSALSAKAAMPATCGEAIDVPEIVLVAVVEVDQAEVMFEPGANTSTHEPKLENEDRASTEVDEATVTADASAAGE